MLQKVLVRLRSSMLKWRLVPEATSFKWMEMVKQPSGQIIIFHQPGFS